MNSCNGDGNCLTQDDINTYVKLFNCSHDCKPQSCPNGSNCVSKDLQHPQWLFGCHGGVCMDCAIMSCPTHSRDHSRDHIKISNKKSNCNIEKSDFDFKIPYGKYKNKSFSKIIRCKNDIDYILAVYSNWKVEADIEQVRTINYIQNVIEIIEDDIEYDDIENYSKEFIELFKSAKTEDKRIKLLTDYDVYYTDNDDCKELTGLINEAASIFTNHPWVIQKSRDYIIIERLCHICMNKLVPIGKSRNNGVGHSDWSTRRYHKTCWKDLIYEAIQNY